MRIVIRYAMKLVPHFQSDGKSIATEATTWSEYPDGGKAMAEQMLASEEINAKDQDCERYSQGFKYENQPSE